MRLIDAGPRTGPPDLRQAFASEPWRERAACRDEADPTLFFYEVPPFQSEGSKFMWSPSLRLPLLTCVGCEVRRDCLRAALEPPSFNHADEDAAASAPRSMFVWGGTLEIDRIHVAHLSVEEQIASLEASFPKRLNKRIVAWRSHAAASNRSRRHANTRNRNNRIADLLAARAVTVAAPRPACERCDAPLPRFKRADARWCSSSCRQAGYRHRLAAA